MDDVASWLERGHEVHALALSGLGGEDDAASVDLHLQAADIVEAIEWNDGRGRQAAHPFA